MGTVTLITGGARSGKSRLAEERAQSHPAPWAYLATAEPRDLEMQHRIAEHRVRRGDGWRTLDCPLELAGSLKTAQSGHGAVLVDCLTLWLSNLLEQDRDIAAETGALCAILEEARVPIYLVTNEVGQGIVPLNPLARRFRDAAGRMNQAVAAVADEVILMVAGLPVQVKAP